MTIDTWIKQATVELVGVGIGTAKLDTELILAHTLRKPRTFLHAHGDEVLSDRHEEIADSRLQLRLDRIPLAYIIGHKEFYGRRFKVTPAVLIPRPESEAVIEMLKELLPNTKALFKDMKRLIDIGTGSGNLGITAKLEFPELDVTLSDLSHHALTIARTNADSLQADVTVLKSDLLTEYVFTPDIILANLPYVDESWERSPETNHEPSEALFARGNGLALINTLIEQAGLRLKQEAFMLLEADPEQHAAIIAHAKKHHFSHMQTLDYCIALKKE